jgi:hypothetical protein
LVKLLLNSNYFKTPFFVSAQRAGASPVYGEVGGVHFNAAAAVGCKILFTSLAGAAAAFLRPEGARKGDIASHNLHAIFA